MVYTANIVRLHLISKYHDWEQLSYDDFGGRAVRTDDYAHIAVVGRLCALDPVGAVFDLINIVGKRLNGKDA